MKTVSLSGSLRENVGKKDTKALRQSEMVPCVMYGAGEEQIHFATAEKNFTKILFTPETYIIDTAGTIVKAGQVMMDNGAKSVRAFATHAVCSGPAMERLDNSVFSEVVVTDTIPLPANASKKIRVVSCAPLFADVIHRVESYESISSLFK